MFVLPPILSSASTTIASCGIRHAGCQETAPFFPFFSLSQLLVFTEGAPWRQRVPYCSFFFPLLNSFFMADLFLRDRDVFLYACNDTIDVIGLVFCFPFSLFTVPLFFRALKYLAPFPFWKGSMFFFPSQSWVFCDFFLS